MKKRVIKANSSRRIKIHFLGHKNNAPFIRISAKKLCNKSSHIRKKKPQSKFPIPAIPKLIVKHTAHRVIRRESRGRGKKPQRNGNAPRGADMYNLHGESASRTTGAHPHFPHTLRRLGLPDEGDIRLGSRHVQGQGRHRSSSACDTYLSRVRADAPNNVLFERQCISSTRESIRTSNVPTCVSYIHARG